MPAEGECGQKYKYRRSMAYLPEWRVCSLPAGHEKRHGQREVEIESAEPAGTCQICFKAQQTKNGNLVLHGYHRPGWGYTVGKCWGCYAKPFEVSCERTKEFIAEVLRPTLARFNKDLEALQAKPESLSHTGRVWVGWQRAKSGYQDATVTVGKGEAAGWKATSILAEKDTRWATGPTVLKGEPEQIQHPSYEDLLSRLIQKKESDIRLCKADIKSYEAKVAAWAPVPWPVQKAVA